MSKRATQLESLLAPIVSESNRHLPDRKPTATPGSVRMMGMALDSLNADAAEAETLRSQLASGDRVVDIDTNIVEHSPFHDRLPEVGHDEAFESLKSSIADGGQQVPILVRPHPSNEGRYQAAYGHRRLRAAHALHIPVRAIVRQMSDAELVIAQGRENLERRDLSYIELAQFAAAIEARGYGRDVLATAVEPNKGNLSVLLSVAKAIPQEIVAAIGPAPKVGRPRWLELADSFAVKGALAIAKAAIKSDEFADADSNSRFAIVLRTLKPGTKAIRNAYRVVGQNGHLIGTLESSARRARLVVENGDFAAYLAERLTELHDEWQSAELKKQ